MDTDILNTFRELTGQQILSLAIAQSHIDDDGATYQVTLNGNIYKVTPFVRVYGESHPWRFWMDRWEGDHWHVLRINSDSEECAVWRSGKPEDVGYDSNPTWDINFGWGNPAVTR